MNFDVLYCHSHESGNLFSAYFCIVDTRLRGYDTPLKLCCVTSVNKLKHGTPIGVLLKLVSALLQTYDS